MSLYDDFACFFPVSSKIIKCYDMLVSLLVFGLDDKEKISDLIFKLNKLMDKEFKEYNKLTVNDINNYVEKLSNTSENLLSLKDMRICFRIASTYDRMRGFSINSKDLFPHLNVDVELGIIDIVNSKIIIDTYKLICIKLNSLNWYDEKSRLYTERMIDLNLQSAIYKLSMREMSELLVLDSLFDINNIPNISLKIVEDILYKKNNKKMDVKLCVRNKSYTDAINFLNRLQTNRINPDNPVSIYDNLFSVTHLEVLLDYLSIEQLKAISSYYEKINIKDKLIAENVKRLFKDRLNSN